MTISSTVRIAGPFIGTGTATVFPYAFKIFAASNLQVVRADSSTGLESTLILNTDYTVSLNTDQDSNPGGNVTLLAVLAVGFTMVITSDIANLQPTDLTNQGGFYPEVITDALDRATIQIQQMADELTRSIKIPISDGLSLDMELPTAAARANSFLAFDATGEPTVVTAGSSGAPTTITRQQFSGTGAQVAFTLASDPGALGNSCEVFIGGIYQQRDTYTIAGTTLTFTAAPVAGTDNIEVVNFLTSAIGTTDSSLVTYVPAGSGATQRTVQAKLRDVVNVKDFGAVGDGVTDDTAALVLAAAALTNNQTLHFEKGTYLISYSGATTHQFGSAYGKVVMALTGLSNIVIDGNGSIIKINNHNCAIGGLTFLNLKSCQRFVIRGFDFDMTFTGVNTSASVYPFCGAITAIDDSAAGQTQSQLCGDALVENCKFKLFHPYGSFSQSGSPFAGDPNNGYKIFSIFTYGPYLATAYAEQCRNVTIKGCVFKDGHNAYGIWNWAWNNVLITENIAENYVSKSSNQVGVYVDGGVPMCRYMQWHCSGYTVSNNKFRAKPSSERTVSGFEGSSRFCYLGTNLTGNYSHGLSSVENNLIIAGNGDSAHSEFDWLVEVAAYGSINISNNIFDGQVSASNNYASRGIITVGEAVSGNGKSSLVISNNSWGSSCSYMDNIVIANSDNASASNRRIKSLTISNNTSLSQLQYFCNMTNNSASTYPGCENVLVDNNVIIGSYNTVWNSANTNSRAFLLASSPTSDVLKVTNNIVRDKYYFAINASISSTATTLINNNNNYGVTVILQDTSTATNHLTKSGTFIPAFSAAGSTFAYATNGQIGRYTRTGNRINFSITLVLATSGNTLAANTLTITGLPFASAAASNTAYISTCLWTAITTSLVNMQSEIGSGSSSMKLFKTTAAGVSSATAMVATDLHATNGSVIEVTGCYEINQDL